MPLDKKIIINGAELNCTNFADNFDLVNLAAEEPFQLRRISKKDLICSDYRSLNNKVTIFLDQINQLHDDFKCHNSDIIDDKDKCPSIQSQELSQLLKTLKNKVNNIDQLHKNHIHNDSSFIELDQPISELLEYSKSDPDFFSSSFLLDSHWLQHLFQSLSIGVISASAIAYLMENAVLNIIGPIVCMVASSSYQSYKNYYQPNNQIAHISNQLIHIEDAIIEIHGKIVDYGKHEY